MFLGASQMKLFYFTSFGKKRLQTAPKTGGEALPNETYNDQRRLCYGECSPGGDGQTQRVDEMVNASPL